MHRFDEHPAGWVGPVSPIEVIRLPQDTVEAPGMHPPAGRNQATHARCRRCPPTRVPLGRARLVVARASEMRFLTQGTVLTPRHHPR